MSKNTAEFAIAGSVMIGRYPHIPIRFQLQSQLRRALGVTEEDDEELRARHKAKKAGEEVDGDFEATHDADPYAIIYVKAAAVGCCWPNPKELKCPTLRDCRHDVVEYGAGVYDALIEMFAKDGKASQVQKDIRREGNKLISDMVAEATKILVTEVDKEKVFTKAQEATGTDG